MIGLSRHLNKFKKGDEVPVERKAERSLRRVRKVVRALVRERRGGEE